MKSLLLGKVKDAKVLKGTMDKRTKRMSGLSGLVIEFETETNITNKTVVGLLCDNTMKPFRVAEVEIKGKKLLGRALECGYWAHKLGKREDLDLRTLIGLDIELVEDAETLKNINEQSCWC